MTLHAYRSLLAAALLALMPALALAQRDGRGRGPIIILDQVESIVNDMNLTPEQRQKIDKIISGAHSSARGMRGELQDADPAIRRGLARGFIADLRDQILAVLTPEQGQQFNQKLQAMGQAATSQPAFGALMERLYDYVNKLDLDEDQKQQVEKLFGQTRQQIMQLRQNPPGDGTMPQKIQQMTQQLRQQLLDVLSPNQQQRLRQMIEQDGMSQIQGERGQGGLRGGAQQTQQPGAKQPDMQNMQAGAVPSVPKVADAPTPDVPGVQVGQPAPPFTLNGLDGRPIQLSNYKGKIVLMIFGSYSSPSFRQRAAAIEQLRRDYSTHINILVVYTRENYPVGQWEVDRNKDEGVAIEQPKEIAARVAQAKQARVVLKLTVPLLVDTMDDKTATDYGGFTNAAVLIGRDQTILARQTWFEPYAMRQHIDEATK